MHHRKVEGGKWRGNYEALHEAETGLVKEQRALKIILANRIPELTLAIRNYNSTRWYRDQPDSFKFGFARFFLRL